MARVDTLGTDTLLFLIDHSVGKGGCNRLDDVQLIQIHLNNMHSLYEKRNAESPEVWKGRQLSGRDGSPIQKLKVDGMCGPKTNEAILGFQNIFGSSAKDGVIHSVKRGQVAYIEGQYKMYKTMFELAIQSHIYGKMTMEKIDVEPLRGNLWSSFRKSGVGKLASIWMPAFEK